MFEKASHAIRLRVALIHCIVSSASCSMMELRIASPERLSYWAFRPRRQTEIMLQN